MKWAPIETATWDGIFLLLVECDQKKERRVFVSERSWYDDEPGFAVTVGWTGWGRLAKGWTPIGWAFLPEPPPISEGINQITEEAK